MNTSGKNPTVCKGLGPDQYMTISVHTTSVQCHIGTLNHALLRDTVGPGNRRKLNDDLLTL